MCGSVMVPVARCPLPVGVVLALHFQFFIMALRNLVRVAISASKFMLKVFIPNYKTFRVLRYISKFF